jgi:hypothetical protein
LGLKGENMIDLDRFVFKIRDLPCPEIGFAEERRAAVQYNDRYVRQILRLLIRKARRGEGVKE